tara:strand:- start:142 stop:738 length:597 start_codon:yes stop_codon:yes gene_type:complete
MRKKFQIKNLIFEEYKKSWDFVKESKNFIYSIIGIFFLFTLIGFFISPPEFLREQIINFIIELLEKTKGMSQLELIKFIFLNNSQSSFFGVILGVILGIFPIMAAMANGYILGFVSSFIVEEKGILVLWRLLPHGIFELPAIFISLGMGLKVGSFIFQEKKFQSLKKYLVNSFRSFFLIVIPLLIIAAIIEGTLIYFF